MGKDLCLTIQMPAELVDVENHFHCSRMSKVIKPKGSKVTL